MKPFISLILTLLITGILTCSCPREPPSLLVPLKEYANFTPKKEIIDGVDYGIPLKVSFFVFIPKSVNAPSNRVPLINNCPTGYRYPTYEEIQKIIKEEGADSPIWGEKGLDLVPNKFYMTSSKTYPDIYNSSDTKFWEYWVYSKKNGSVNISSIIGYYYSNDAKCVKDGSSNFKIIAPDSLNINEKVEFSLDSENVKGGIWKVGNQLFSMKNLQLVFSSPGCKVVEMWAKNISDMISYSCQVITVNSIKINNKTTKLSLNSISNINTGITINPITNLFFVPSNGPISPKSDGGFYLAYSSKNGDLHVREYDSEYKQVTDQVIKNSAIPMDIAATDWGFAILWDSKDNTKVAFSGFYSDFTPKFETIMFHNDEGAFKRKDQLRLYNGKSDYFGMNSMYRGENGKIVYANGMFAVTFARYNNFNAGLSEENGHTGDIIFTSDENGENERMVNNWSSSHSLIQTMIFNGRYFVHVALGDAFPENIQAVVFDPKRISGNYDFYNQRVNGHPSSSTTLHDSVIPGDHSGNAGGRIGSVSFNGYSFAVPFSVKPCKTSYSETTANEFGIITFQLNNTKIVNIEKKLFSGLSAVNIVQIRSGKYGKNIMISYIMSRTDLGQNLPTLWYVRPGNYDVYYLLCGFDGKIVSGPFMSTATDFNHNDDFRELNNGALVWSSVSQKSELILNYLPTP